MVDEWMEIHSEIYLGFKIHIRTLSAESIWQP
jgi:hypothetical protein